MPVCRGVSRLPPFLGWFVCVSCLVAVVIVWFESRLSRYGSFALLSVVRGCRFVCYLLGGGGGIWFLFPFLYCFLVYFPDSISSMFLFRWKATVGEFGNSCCRLLLFMRSHPFVRAFLVFLRCGWYLVMYTKGILLFSGLSAKRLFLSYSRAWLKYWSVSWVLYPLSISLFLKLVRADLSCQDRSWCGFLRWQSRARYRMWQHVVDCLL